MLGLNTNQEHQQGIRKKVLNHNDTPLMSAHLAYSQKDIIPFDVPGHKRGRGNPYLEQVFGEQTITLDVNSLPELDQLSHPEGVIKDAQELMANAYGADHALFMVNGTTAGIHTMILATCQPGDKILLPRNVHKSAVNALILSGAIPVYIDVEIHEELGIVTTVQEKKVIQKIKEHRDAKAILLLNPTYWGFCTNLENIIRIAHRHSLVVLVDEAHGAHFPFHDWLPHSASRLGADLVATSVHKTGGAFTQSSVLLVNDGRVDIEHVAIISNMIQSTSASYLLMSSLDAARKNLVLNGRKEFSRLIPLIEQTKKELQSISGITIYDKDILGHKGIHALDATKIGIHVSELGLTGFQIYEILRIDYKIQLELGDAYNVLAIVSLGDDERTLRSLVDALSDLSKKYFGKSKKLTKQYIPALKPEVVMNPREAFYAPKESVDLSEAIGRISGECVMAYPPGIPILSPGEMITNETVSYIQFLKENHANLTDAKDVNVERLMVIRQGVW